jgi:hypothetical protein
MKKFRAITAAAAALMVSAPLSYAQLELEGQWYVIDQQGGSKLVIGPANPQGSPLLVAEAGAAPANCPEGSFWEMDDGTIVACGDATAFFDLRAPTPEDVVNTEPFPENAMLLIPRDTGESDSDQDTNTQSN